MYKGPRGFILRSTETPGGWNIQTLQDVETALYTFPAFQTVYSGFLLEALEQAIADRKEYEDITELAEFLAANYI